MSGESWRPFLPIQPDETLFGWVVAYSRIAALPESRDVSRRLCGHATAILRHDFPSRLIELCNRLENNLGTAEALIHGHTLLPFFSPFLTEQVHRAALDAMLTGGTVHLRALLGLNASRIVLDAPLKACPICRQQDLQRFHRALWHRNHQWPTTLVCTAHRTLLQVATTEFHGARHLPLLTPNDFPSEAWATMTTHEYPGIREKLLRLATWTERFVVLEASLLSSRSLRETYALGAKARGFLALDGSIRLKPLRDAFDEYYAEVTQLPSFAFLAATQGANGGFLGQLVRQYEYLHHPAKHIALAAFLFDSWEDFRSAHCIAMHQIGRGIPARNSARRAALIEALDQVRAGASVNSVAQTLGAPTTQLIQHAKREGVMYESRPRIVGTEKEMHLVSLLRAGRSRSSIARRLGLRQAFIKDYLATREDLKIEWAKRNQERIRLAHRLRFVRTLDRNPGVPIKRIRRIPSNGFQWLYNNDRDWLRDVLPAIWKR